MTLRTVCKELVRTPGKTLLFLLLLALASALLVLGVNLYISCGAAREQVSANYKTVGTIQQKPDSTWEIDEDEAQGIMAALPWYDPYAKYTVSLPGDLFDGLPTKLPVENRPTLVTTAEYYSPDNPEKVSQIETPQRIWPLEVLTFSPTEDVDTDDEEFMATHGIARGMRFVMPCRLLSINRETPGTIREERIFWTSDDTSHVALRAGTEYIAAAGITFNSDGTTSYCLQKLAAPVQTGQGSTDFAYAGQTAYEYTPDFFQTEEGQWAADLMESSKNLSKIKNHAVITVPTQSLDLLDPFYQDKVTIRYGREITPEEFESGAKVCMISDDFLFMDDPEQPSFINMAMPGDKLRLSWYGAIYGENPAQTSPHIASINLPQASADYAPADSEEYEIVGIFYSEMNGMDYQTGSATSFGSYEIIVPSASHDFSSLPILQEGPLTQGCCSFELENGAGDVFLEAIKNLEYSDLLQVSLHDQGYTSVAKGLDAIALLATILLLSGAASVLCLLLFFVYLQIARRQREAAIQLSLGAGKRRSAAFLLLSVLLVAAVGIASGSLLGHAFTDKVSSQVYTQAAESGFSREYSDQFEASNDKSFLYDGKAKWPHTLASGLSAFAAALALSTAFTVHSLSKEPLEQLTRKD